MSDAPSSPSSALRCDEFEPGSPKRARSHPGESADSMRLDPIFTTLELDADSGTCAVASGAGMETGERVTSASDSGRDAVGAMALDVARDGVVPIDALRGDRS